MAADPPTWVGLAAVSGGRVRDARGWRTRQPGSGSPHSFRARPTHSRLRGIPDSERHGDALLYIENGGFSEGGFGAHISIGAGNPASHLSDGETWSFGTGFGAMFVSLTTARADYGPFTSSGVVYTDTTHSGAIERWIEIDAGTEAPAIRRYFRTLEGTSGSYGFGPGSQTCRGWTYHQWDVVMQQFPALRGRPIDPPRRGR